LRITSKTNQATWIDFGVVQVFCNAGTGVSDSDPFLLDFIPAGSSGTSGTSGTSGSSGTSGTSGSSGTNTSICFVWDSSQPPSSNGQIASNDGTLGSFVNTIYINDVDNNGANVQAYLDSITIGSTLNIGFQGQYSYTINSNTDSGSYHTFGVTYISGPVNIAPITGILVCIGSLVQGSSGTSGSSGTRGTSGTTGSSGTSGSSGTRGTSGTAGSSGTSGTVPGSRYFRATKTTTAYDVVNNSTGLTTSNNFIANTEYADTGGDYDTSTGAIIIPAGQIWNLSFYFRVNLDANADPVERYKILLANASITIYGVWLFECSEGTDSTEYQNGFSSSLIISSGASSLTLYFWLRSEKTSGDAAQVPASTDTGDFSNFIQGFRIA
jgi:hypothetical protein